MTYDITNPRRPAFCSYVNNRDFEADADTPEAGDFGPEGIIFIPWYESPIRRPLLAVANEISGTVTVYEVKLDGRCRG